MLNVFSKLTKGQFFSFKLLIIGIVVLILLFAPSYLSRYYLYLVTLILVTVLFATSLNIPLGYGGLLVLHQATFYGVGAYAFAIFLKQGTLPILPASLIAPLIAAAFACFIGWICVRLRGLYFSFLTLAMGQLVWAIIYRWYNFTGGDDGIHAIPVPDFLRSGSSVFYTTLIVVLISLLLIYIIVKSPYGLTLQAVRDNPQRCESVGINIRNHRLIAFVMGGFFAGVAGVLFVLLERSVAPPMLFWTKSVEVLIMVLLGGMFTFLGPAFGAVVVIGMMTFFGIFTEYWLLFLGSIKILLLLFLPQGVLGYIEEMMAKSAKKIEKGEERGYAQG
ncbi:MAG: branched-chain amino acid ABC transporter permease [Bacillota bacterium]